MEKGSLRLPKVGDIWKDSHGHFLVIEEHGLHNIDFRDGYVCSISVVALEGDWGITAQWTLKPKMIKEMEFIA